MSLLWRGAEVVKEYRQAAAQALTTVAEAELGNANQTCPIEETTLIRSGAVAPATANNLTATISYDTPYAVVQHEDTTFRHDPGRRAKWLELTLREDAAAVGVAIGREMRRRLA